MSKKTETIEIRVSPEMKDALAQTCEKESQTMSAYLRDLVEQATADGPILSQNGGAIMAHIIPRTFKSAAVASLPVVALAGLYLIGIGGSVMASPEYRLLFTELDSDANGQISETEFNAQFTDIAPDDEPFDVPAACEGFGVLFEDAEPSEALDTFQTWDSNQDAHVSYDELAAIMQRERLEMFLEVDHNSDGLVTMTEITAFLDGSLVVDTADSGDAAEDACFDALNSAIVAQYPEDESEESFEEDLQMSARLMLAQFDQDFDGVLTFREILEN